MLPLRKLGGTGRDWNGNAIYNHGAYGPTFGGGFDLHIATNPHANADSCHMMGVERGGSYCVPAGVNPNVTPPVLASALHFTVAKLRVYEVVASQDASPLPRLRSIAICKVDADLGADQYESPENYRNMLQSFVVSEAAERYDAICKAAQGEHWGLLHLAAHALKGSSGMVYATGMNEVCLQLHRACTSEGSLAQGASVDEAMAIYEGN